MANSITGVEANHVSTEKSVASSDHAQSDDAVNSNDANMAAGESTGGTLDWQAGPMSGFQDNDDYCYTQMAAEVLPSRFAVGSDPPTDHVDPYRDQAAIGVNAVIVRRI